MNIPTKLFPSDLFLDAFTFFFVWDTFFDDVDTIEQFAVQYILGQTFFHLVETSEKFFVGCAMWLLTIGHHFAADGSVWTVFFGVPKGLASHCTFSVLICRAKLWIATLQYRCGWEVGPRVRTWRGLFVIFCVSDFLKRLYPMWGRYCSEVVLTLLYATASYV